MVDIQELLGLCVVCGLALTLDMLLVSLGSLVRSGGGDELVRERSLVGGIGNLRRGGGQHEVYCWVR